jgi:hypothetical protein
VTGRGPLNYTTKIPVTKTTSECLDLLAQAGADSASISYTDRKPTGLAFRLNTPHGPRDFSMPVNIDGIRQLLAEVSWPASGVELRRLTAPGHAAEVAWRIVKDWLEAQLALVAAQMVTIDEVMLPYLQVGPGVTLWQAYLERESTLALTGGTS